MTDIPTPHAGKPRAIAVVGPTAVGKSGFAVRLAKWLDGEIISCDSMQLYRGMDIGTAKITREEADGIPHHMIDILDCGDRYSAADYAREALSLVRDIRSRGRVPIFCGGTGLYLEAVRSGRHSDFDFSDAEYVRELTEIAESEGGRERLHAMLAECDPKSAEKTDKNNVRRVIRALEIYRAGGIPKSELDRRSLERESDVDMLILGLRASSREVLYERINRRVDEMLERGLLGETERLWRMGALAPDTTAGQAIGYKELLPYLEGTDTLTSCAESLKTASRRYAKRQLTWFSASPSTVWLTTDRDGVPLPFDTVIQGIKEDILNFISEDTNEG